jgi:hypothetical protein
VHTVHGKFCQCVSAARCEGPPPRCEAATRRNPPGLYLPIHQGTWNNSAYLRCVYYHGFPPGVRDEKMLEKLATHQVDTVTTLFALADKCARAAEGRAWHSATQARPAQTSGPSVAASSSGKKKNKNSRGFDKSRIGGPAVAAATTGGQNPRGKCPRQQRTGPGSCPVHPGARHSATECREIQKLAECLSKRRDQASREGSSPPRRSGKEKASDVDAAAAERELGYQTPNKDLKGLFHESDSESGGDERRKKLYVMYGGSSELVSRRDVKTFRREALSVKPATLKAAPHQRLKNVTISFGPSDCPKNMAGAGVLPLVTAPTIANVRLHHVVIDGGAGLSVISYAVFKHLQIPESKLTPSRPFSGVGPDPMYPVGTITLPVTFGMEDNLRTENVQFEVAEVNLPINAIIGRPALYRFLAVAHYGYLVLKMPSPAGVVTVQSDRAAAVVAVEKLHALATGLACSWRPGV